MKKVVLSALAATIVSSALYAETMTLFTDPKTGQVFTTAGEGRVMMGDFIDAKSIDEHFREDESHVAEYESKINQYVDTDKKNWSNKLKIGGYVQIRNTEWLDGEDKINASSTSRDSFRRYWADGSTENDKNFLIRRARLILSGNIGDHLGLYFQPDFGSTPGSATTSNFGQLRDLYGDIFIDKTKEHRVRIGQSKVPYGFENMQSSSKRLTLDRNDAINSAARDERDMGAFYYYTPVAIQELLKEIDDLGLKGSGNYGMFALGAYNGQGANNVEKNGNYHIVTRFTYPFKTESGQIFEFSAQAYSGRYVINPTSNDDASTASGRPPLQENAKKGMKDERIGITAIMYPQPFGIQAEWNWGTAPGATTGMLGTTRTNAVEEKSLNGGYIQPMYRMTNVLKDGDVLTPFIKWQYFDGYSKAETNAPRNQVNDWEFGAEWQVAKEFELTGVIHKMNRTDIAGNFNGYNQRFEGTALRVQAQFNY
ncbi:MAG: OprO/OprP family phosphate-selective porin [Epsilonproteobacteria bacterium]|nr:OprO/OprP family phosphate-selective porin [Campylobacterota bacterium]